MSEPERTRGHIPWSNVDRRLRSARELWVTTAGPDGRPDAVPVWFWWDGRYVYFATKLSSRKAHNIAAQPAVVVHNGDGADPIIVKGDADLVTDPGELAGIDRAYREKYVDPHSGAHATVFNEGDGVFRVEPRVVTTWSYATCSSRTDFRFDPVAVG